MKLKVLDVVLDVERRTSHLCAASRKDGGFDTMIVCFFTMMLVWVAIYCILQ